MTPPERAALLERYRTADAALADALPQFPPAMWHFKPDAQTWSIHENIIHIADSEANSYIRCRRAIAEPGQNVTAYDENVWCNALNYAGQSTDTALTLFRALRGATYTLLQTLPDATWAQTIQHPQNGTMTLDDWLEVYAAHVPDHIAAMHTVFAAWQKISAL